MKTPLIAFAALAATLPYAATEAEPPKRSPEVQVLDRFVGTWNVKYVVKPAEGAKISYDGVSTRAWSPGGEFVRFEELNSKSPDPREFQMLVTYDSDAKNYPGFFMHGPARGQITGTWDEKTQTMAWSSTLPDGYKIASTHRFIGKSRAEASGTITSPDDKILVELSWNQTRRKETVGCLTTHTISGSRHQSTLFRFGNRVATC
jgi:hypothetical protein